MAGAAVSTAESFQRDLQDLGFRLVQDRGSGTVQYARTVSQHLTFWVHWNIDEQTVLFTWELAIGEYFDSLDLQIGSNEALNQFLFPKYDARGAQDTAFVVAEMDRAEKILAGIDLLGGGRND